MDCLCLPRSTVGINEESLRLQSCSLSCRRSLWAPSHNRHQVCICQAKDNLCWDKLELPSPRQHQPRLDAAHSPWPSTPFSALLQLQVAPRCPRVREPHSPILVTGPGVCPQPLKTPAYPYLRLHFPTPQRGAGAMVWDKRSQTPSIPPPQATVPSGRAGLQPCKQVFTFA